MQTAVSRVSAAFGTLFPAPVRRFVPPLEPAILRMLMPAGLVDGVEAARAARGRPLPESLLDSLGIRYTATGAEKIPRSGPAMVVANHPFGMVEGIIMADLLGRVRPDVRILANSLLAVIPELEPYLIPVDPFGGAGSAQRNARPLRQALEWVRGGGILAMFPAGEVAHLNWKEHPVADPLWNPAVAGLARLAGCPVTPVFFAGANSAAFQIAGMIHPRLRTISLPRELYNKRGRCLSARVGAPVSPAVMRATGDDRAATDYLRYRTYLLGENPGSVRLKKDGAKLCPLAQPVPPATLERELGGLKPLCGSGTFEVYVARADEIPNTLREIGRLRELSFRAAGEGTGAAEDIDEFDSHYLHLFVWNSARTELVGAYRLGPVTEILAGHGPSGLYTSTLFHYDSRLFEHIGPALELGRSFVRPEYQRQYGPLLLLWKGIAKFAASRPDSPVLFGAVSISEEYSRASRDLMVKFLETQRDERLAAYVRPRRRYRRSPRSVWQEKAIARFVRDVEQLADPVSDLEPDGKRVPVLLKQYLKLGGRTLGISVDPAFSWVVDALIMVDLRHTAREALDRYMGTEAAARFRKHHRIGA